MHLRSMTGFGRGEADSEGKTWIAEIRTVNHRFLDQRVVLPRSFIRFEEAVKKKVAEIFERGRVDLTLLCQNETEGETEFVVNTKLASQYHRCLQKLKNDYLLAGSITLQDMLSQGDMILQKEREVDLDKEWAVISAALDRALLECDRMRQQEGLALKKELVNRLDGFQALVTTIEMEAPQILAHRQQELQDRLGRLLDAVDIDDARLAQEAAILADKSDITEEIVRLQSHIRQFRGLMEGNEPVGRRLDFLLQEFLREVNTLASKIANVSVAHLGVEMKNEIEKLREQVQNLE
ncbi:MAG: YicC family protein [Desulfobulbus propionicus]|nr:MAG: YicC family protein [Desulfobulbus propionicus]